MRPRFLYSNAGSIPALIPEVAFNSQFCSVTFNTLSRQIRAGIHHKDICGYAELLPYVSDCRTEISLTQWLTLLTN